MTNSVLWLHDLGKITRQRAKDGTLITLRDEIEREMYKSTMYACKYNQSRAARVLGVSRGCLRMKLHQYFGDQFFKVKGE